MIDRRIRRSGIKVCARLRYLHRRPLFHLVAKMQERQIERALQIPYPRERANTDHIGKNPVFPLKREQKERKGDLGSSRTRHGK